jgi:hypothetical protein
VFIAHTAEIQIHALGSAESRCIGWIALNDYATAVEELKHQFVCHGVDTVSKLEGQNEAAKVLRLSVDQRLHLGSGLRIVEVDRGIRGQLR